MLVKKWACTRLKLSRGLRQENFVVIFVIFVVEQH